VKGGRWKVEGERFWNAFADAKTIEAAAFKLKVDSGKWKVQEQISPWPI
jgi:hypothetical protein